MDLLPERIRCGLLRELLAVADGVIDIVEMEPPADEAIIAIIVGKGVLEGRRLRKEMGNGYSCPLNDRFDAVADAIEHIAVSHTDESFRELRGAAFRARGITEGVDAKSVRTIETPLGGEVYGVAYLPSGRVRLVANVKVLCECFGAPLVANLFRVLAGADRIASLLHLIRLNGKHVPHDSVAYERNFHFAAVQILAYLKELSGPISQLSVLSLADRLTNTEPWDQLLELMKRWKSKTSTEFRDDVVFHLGHAKETTTVVERLASRGQSTIVLEWDGADRSDQRYVAGEELLLEAVGLTMDVFDDLIRDGVQSFGPLFTSISLIVDDLLRQCGATRMPSLEQGTSKLLDD